MPACSVSVTLDAARLAMACRTPAIMPFDSLTAGALPASALAAARASGAATDSRMAIAGATPLLNSRAPNQRDTPITKQAATFRNRPIAISRARRLGRREGMGFPGAPPLLAQVSREPDLPFDLRLRASQNAAITE